MLLSVSLDRRCGFRLTIDSGDVLGAVVEIILPIVWVFTVVDDREYVHPALVFMIRFPMVWNRRNFIAVLLGALMKSVVGRIARIVIWNC